MLSYEKVIAWSKKPAFRIGLAVVLVLVLGGTAGGIYLTQTTPPQPIQFPHSVHVGIGAQCLYCHPGAVTGPVAGLPTQAKCWGCHQQVKKTDTSPELQKLVKYVKDNQPIPWVPVAIEPDFVHFNHRPHIAAGLSCENCHGNVAKMKTAVRQKGQNMGWCLDCHKRMRPEKFVKLSSCETCHY
jgi:hypothetical protein